MKKLIKLLCFFVFVSLFLTNNSYPSNFKLPDTGQTICFNHSDTISCPKKGEDYYGQDGNFIINPPKYEVKVINGDKVVIDKNTNLMWMWMPADFNGNGKVTTMDDLMGYDRVDWKTAYNYCKNLNFAGYSDWRLPSIQELNTLTYYNNYDKLYDINDVFYTTFAVHAYCSSTPFADKDKPNTYWEMDFGGGGGPTLMDITQDNCYVRCVRGDKIDFSNPNRFKILNDKIALDTLTNLMWQRGHADGLKNWKDALAYCANLDLGGFHDWRLPNVHELLSIIDYSKIDPAVDTNIFKDSPSDDNNVYWSSTSSASNVSNYFFLMKNKLAVSIANGSIIYNDQDTEFRVRCVRGGNISQNIQTNNFNLTPNSNDIEINDNNSYIPIKFSITPTGGTPPYKFWWNFGDGETSTEPNPVHVYKKLGTYTVFLIIIDSTGKYTLKEFKVNLNDYINQNNQENNSELIVPTNWHICSIPINPDNTVGKINVNNYFNKNGIISIWKWNGTSWDFWSPKTNLIGLAKKYNLTIFTNLKIGEGFWIDTNKEIDVHFSNGKKYGIEALNIKNGWNLLGIGEDIYQKDFKNFGNIQTLWKWNGKSWEIWSPDEKIQQIIKNYNISEIKEIKAGEGFWIEK